MPLENIPQDVNFAQVAVGSFGNWDALSHYFPYTTIKVVEPDPDFSLPLADSKPSFNALLSAPPEFRSLASRR